MRLTLRTLLAYMDEILEPEDTQEIAKKIADSPVATELMHRIRDVMRRLRLGAPSVLDRAAGLDANTVAEYLDNTLSDAQLPDFETICLESDLQLAEVASCHRILALVLGEPAEVDPRSRERVYQLLHGPSPLADEATLPGPPPLAGAPMAVASEAEESDQRIDESRVPTYLREPPTGRRWQWFVGLAVIVLVVVGLLFLSGRFGGRNLLAKFWGAEQPAATGGNTSDANGPATEVPGGRGEADEIPSFFGPTAPTPSASNPAAGAPSVGDAGPGATLPAAAKTAAAEGVGLPGAQPAAETSDGKTEASKTGPGKTAADGSPIAPEAPKAPNGEMPVIPKPPASATPAPGVPDVGTSAPKGVTGADAGLAQPPGATSVDTGPKPPGPVPGGASPVAEKSSVVGHLVSTKEVLLSVSADPVPQATWRQVPGQADLYSGEKLLSLPAFRPVISLVGHVKVQWIDGTLAQILPLDAQGVPGLAVSYGRMVMKAEEGTGTRVRLQLGQQMILVALESVESSLAIDVHRQVVPGTDPETQPGPVTADLYVTSGKVGWQDDPGNPPVTLEAPIRRVWGPRLSEAVSNQQFPKWVFSDTTGLLEQNGARVLERELSTGRPANLVLRELVDFRLREARSLAVRSLSLLGDFEPVLRALDDPDQKLYWDDCIAQLRAGVTRDPTSAAAVRSTMERFYGPQGASLYEMLWKYGPALSSADARQLTEYLDHQTLAFRILAFWNLRNIYAGMTLNYHAEYPSAKRQAAVQAWKERLKTPPPPPRETPPKRGAKAAPRKAPAETTPPPEPDVP